MTNIIKDKAIAKRPSKADQVPKDAKPSVTGAAKSATPASKLATAHKPTKLELVIEMLKRPEGGTLDQIVEATGWLPHTSRAALTGLKKKGHVITSEKAEGTSRIYRVANA